MSEVRSLLDMMNDVSISETNSLSETENMHSLASFSRLE